MDLLGATLIYIAICFLVIIPWMKIFDKTGYSRWLSLVMIIPILNYAVFVWFAIYDEWPLVTSQKRRLKKLQLYEPTIVCDDCENPVKEQDKYCSSCGKGFEIQNHICPKCRRKMDSKDEYCASCGVKLI